MAEPTVAAVMSAIATAVETALDQVVDDLGEVQVAPYMLLSPTPPAIDVFPAEEFIELIGFGPTDKLSFTVRARVSTVANVEAQELLLSLMDPNGSASLADALLKQTLIVDSASYNLTVDGPTGFQVYRDVGGGGDLIGCAWTVGVML